MSASVAGPVTGSGEGTRRRRRGVLWLLLAATVLTVLAFLSGGQEERTGPLDPRNPGPDGAQAVARVLDARGVPVTVVRSIERLLATDLGGATVVVTGTELLGERTLTRLQEGADGQDTTAVYVGSARLLADLVLRDGTAASSGSVPAGERAADCAEPLASGLTASLDPGPGLSSPVGTTCFGDPGVLVRTDALQPVDSWLLTAPEVMANDSVTEADNAALALRLLGQRDRLVWYVPDPADTGVEEGVTLGELLPPWLVPAAWLALIAALAFVLWRGRRLGPLVTEPLPVVVRAAESTHSRGRLYHRTSDRAHAAAVLREATSARLARRLRLPADAAPESVAAAAARRTTQEEAAVRDLLTGPPPTDDTRLADLGRRLSSLEDEVQRP